MVAGRKERQARRNNEKESERQEENRWSTEFQHRRS